MFFRKFYFQFSWILRRYNNILYFLFINGNLIHRMFNVYVFYVSITSPFISRYEII